MEEVIAHSHLFRCRLHKIFDFNGAAFHPIEGRHSTQWSRVGNHCWICKIVANWAEHDSSSARGMWAARAGARKRVNLWHELNRETKRETCRFYTLLLHTRVINWSPVGTEVEPIYEGLKGDDARCSGHYCRSFSTEPLYGLVDTNDSGGVRGESGWFVSGVPSRWFSLERAIRSGLALYSSQYNSRSRPKSRDPPVFSASFLELRRFFWVSLPMYTIRSTPWV
jgi:hypothetical protein